jgi:Cutinase
VHPGGWRNDWWARTKSDDHKWGWTPEVFFKGGANNERDAGLRKCGGGSARPKQPKPPRKPKCTDYRILGLRGSGEKYAGQYKMGGTVGETALGVALQLRDQTHKSVSAYSIPYPAAPVSDLEHPATFQKFFDSMDLGTRLLNAEINSYLGDCPHANLAVIGYSQGAGAASEALRHLLIGQASHIGAVALYADT